MSLTSSLYVGTSGLDASSTDLDVIGNNIANANTIGYKGSRADFETQMSENLMGGQIGLGTELQKVQQIMTEGSIVTTGVSTDLALQGNGFFVVSGENGGVQGQYYTRNGQFTVDNNGFLVNQNGLQVQGYEVDANGNLDGQLGALQVGSATSQPVATSTVTLQANLNSNDTPPVGGFVSTTPSQTSNFSTTTTVYDSLGNAHQVQVYFVNDGGGTWEWHAMTDGSGVTGGTAGTPTEIAGGTLTFGTNGQLVSQTVTNEAFNPIGAAQAQPLTFNLGTPTGTGGTGLDGVTDFASPDAATKISQNGYGSGTLTSVNVATNGNIEGTFSNGQSSLLGSVAIANFQANDQLSEQGNNLYQQTLASGEPTIGTAGSGANGSITSGSLEQSNVNLSDEFVNMIAAQRDFQANARTVSAADALLQDLMQINANGT